MKRKQRNEVKAGINLLVSIILIVCGLIVGVFDGTPAHLTIDFAFILILLQFAFNRVWVSEWD